MYKLIEGDSNSTTDCTCSKTCPVHGWTRFTLDTGCDSFIPSIDKTAGQKNSEKHKNAEDTSSTNGHDKVPQKTNNMETQTDDTFGEVRFDLIDESSIL